MSKYLNVYVDGTGKNFYYIITISGNRFIEAGFKTAEEAAWQCDRAKWFLNSQSLMGRKTAYNYPERIAAETETAWSVPIRGLWDFIEECKGTDETIPSVSHDEAERMENARAIAQGQLDREREVEEAKCRLVKEQSVKDQTAARETLQAIISTLRQAAVEFDALNLPKNTKERNAIHNAIGMMGARLAQL